VSDPRSAGAAPIGALLRWGAILAAWAAALLGLVFTVPTVLGATPHRVYAAMQLGRPWLGLAAGIPLLVAVFLHRPALALVSGFCVIANVAPVWLAVTDVDVAASSPDAVSIYVANVQSNNATPEAQVEQVMASGADVLVLIELTDRFVELLSEQGADVTYPHRHRPFSADGKGEAIYSRVPFVDTGELQFAGSESPVAWIPFGDQTLRVVGVHTSAPIYGGALEAWIDELDALRANLEDGAPEPSVVAGDFNAARWHPVMADLLSTRFRDAHERVGRGLTSSWPADGIAKGRVLQPLGPIVRLDHALVDRVGVVEVVDLPAVGSDHVPFIVTVVAEEP
jgi:endonuclease/exonuclease/phosphatase (EEP) superfamily protein YafD